MKLTLIECLICLVLLGCASKPRKECNLELLRQHYPVEMRELMTQHPGFAMEMFKMITTLEQEAGGYR